MYLQRLHPNLLSLRWYNNRYPHLRHCLLPFHLAWRKYTRLFVTLLASSIGVYSRTQHECTSQNYPLFSVPRSWVLPNRKTVLITILAIVPVLSVSSLMSVSSDARATLFPGSDYCVVNNYTPEECAVVVSTEYTNTWNIRGWRLHLLTCTKIITYWSKSTLNDFFPSSKEIAFNSWYEIKFEVIIVKMVTRNIATIIDLVTILVDREI